MGSRRSSTRIALPLALALAVLVVPGVALADRSFPGADPDESPRANTPNDPQFDRCEPDDPDTQPPRCASYFNQQFRLFGFSPRTANQIPDPTGTLPHWLTGTRYLDCSQLDAQGRRANVLAEGVAGNPVAEPLAECLQIGGIRADTAWKHSIGDPDVVIAVLDSGIRWQERDLVDKIHLNRGELPEPLATRDEPLAGDIPCSEFDPGYDANGDGKLSVSDYACDPRVEVDAGVSEADHMLDPSDLIAAFSNGEDSDGNGFVDDIAGWDFFDDDNNPFDASSCCSSAGHGTGRALEAAAETDNALGGAGVCPECQVMPLRVWDTFIVPGDFFAMGIVYAADNGASVAAGAVSGLTNTRFARRAFSYADQRGVALTMVSSDINSANHNYPTNYDEAIYVGGAFPDTAPLDNCDTPSLPGLPDVVPAPGEATEACEELLGILAQPPLNITPTPQPITTSFFRNSNLSQYGGKADIVLMGTTGSQNTGQAAGAAGLLASYGREVFGDEDPLSGNEIRQLLTMSAEDVLPANTGVIGLPDKANPGWDPHFGYGRVNLAGAMRRIADDRVPPEAQLGAPDWFTPINVDRVPGEGIEVHGRAAAPRAGAAVGGWQLDYACGQDAPDTSFQPVPGASGNGPVDGAIGTLSRSLLADLADSCDGSVANDAGRPAGTLSDPWPANPYPSPDPERHAFQIRLTVREQGDPQNFGRYRKTLFAYRDDGNLEGWPRPVGSGSDPERLVTGSGGEVAPRLYDLSGDNRLEVILGTSSGELWVLKADGAPLGSFNGGEPVRTDPYHIVRGRPVPAGLGGQPREPLRAPAIGDVTGDLEPEIVATAGEHVYAWKPDGSRVEGFPVRIDPALSEPCRPGVEKPCLKAGDRAITPQNHIKRGFFGSPALADLTEDGRLEIVAGALDQHVYVWDGDGDLVDPFPVKLESDGAAGAEIATSPAIAQLDGTGPPEIVIATNEIVPGDPELPSSVLDLFNILIGAATGSNPIYALHADGTPVEGWPVEVGVIAGDLLPLVLPGNDAAVLDRDGDGRDEVVVTAATTFAPAGTRLVDGGGETLDLFANPVANTIDQGPVVNVADYPSIGALEGSGPAVIKGGITLNGAVNLLAPNQNVPFSHVVQAWDPASGLALAGYPRATDDWQLLSQPAVAKVDGSGSHRHALHGTGLYQLHAYGPLGQQAPGWPKFLGGWVQATPAVGDANGDGKLDVVAVTREGWSFLWGTEADACEVGGAATNREWWTSGHDEHGTSNYGHDSRPPGSPEDLEATREGDGSVSLRWTAPGDDWMCGKAARFRVLVSDAEIESPADGQVALARDAAAAAGEEEAAVLSEAEAAGATHAGVVYRDEAGNWGRPRGVALPAAEEGNGNGDGEGRPGPFGLQVTLPDRPQRSLRRIRARVRCLGSDCTVRARGRLRVRFPGGRTRGFPLGRPFARLAAGRARVLRLVIPRRARRPARRALRRGGRVRARVRVFATDGQRQRRQVRAVRVVRRR